MGKSLLPNTVALLSATFALVWWGSGGKRVGVWYNTLGYAKDL